jgi:hypothetical protein
VLLGCLPDVVDDAAQVMHQAIVVIGLYAEESGLGVARDRTKRVVDVVPRKANPHVANRDRQPRCGRAPIDWLLCCGGVLL